MIGVAEQHLTRDERHGDTTDLMTITDILIRRTQATYPDATATLTYDSVGRLIKTSDTAASGGRKKGQAGFPMVGAVETNTMMAEKRLQPMNRVTEIADARHGLTRFAYDPNGNLLTVTDAKNQVTTYTYDNMDRLATRKDALNRTESYQYL